MTFDPQKLLNLPPRETRQTYSEKDTILYALGVGAGIGDIDDVALRYVYEENLLALPTMAAVLGSPGFWQKEPEYGIEWQKVLHADQSVQFHQPLPAAAAIRTLFTIEEIYDKGADKGALLYAVRKLYDDQSGALLATVRQGSFLRGNGGCGGQTTSAPPPHPVPAAEKAAAVISLPTRPEQALIYRLSGDYNPLHADPAVARAVGFPQPILHGLCTYGIAGRALLMALCDNDPARLKRMDTRFSSPVYPGETIRTEIWREGPGRAAFQSKVEERDIVVLNNGYAEFEG